MQRAGVGVRVAPDNIPGKWPDCVRLVPSPRHPAAMNKKALPAALHLVMFALVVALAAWWALRILTPAPLAAPPVAPPAPVREADPVAAARMFGKVDAVASAASVQVAGVFAAGKDSSAVLLVDGRPARAYRLGQEVAPGMKLLAVDAGGVTLAVGEARLDARVPARPAAAPLGGPAPAPGHSLQNQILSAPSVGGTPAAAPRAVEPAPGTPQPLPAGAALPRFESPVLTPPPMLPAEAAPRSQ